MIFKIVIIQYLSARDTGTQGERNEGMEFALVPRIPGKLLRISWNLDENAGAQENKHRLEVRRHGKLLWLELSYSR